jgi:hypothetical protein
MPGNAAPPSPEVLEEITALHRRVMLSSRAAAVPIGLAVLAMALLRAGALKPRRTWQTSPEPSSGREDWSPESPAP